MWQSIETAPGMKIILLFAVTHEENGVIKNWKMAAGCKDCDGMWLWDGRAVKAWDIKPTHWMPLPEPPL